MGVFARMIGAAGLCVASSVSAQSRTSGVAGVVRDSTGAPVIVATITADRLQTLTDSTGSFSLEHLPAGRVTVNVRRLGFRPANTTVDLVEGQRDSLFVTLVSLPRVLPEVTSAADTRLREYLADYYRHRDAGAGRFYDRAQITAMRVTGLTDMLRRVPGVRVTSDRNGRYSIRMGRSVRNCPPDFWVDNVRVFALNPDDIPVSDIEAIEIYAGPAGLPPELINRFGNPACGAVVIWTRMPG